jgi:hypothetical protein
MFSGTPLNFHCCAKWYEDENVARSFATLGKNPSAALIILKIEFHQSFNNLLSNLSIIGED